MAKERQKPGSVLRKATRIRFLSATILAFNAVCCMIGCNESESAAQLRAKTMQNQSHEFPTNEFAVTAKLRREYAGALTRDGCREAKTALVANLKVRFAGINAKVTGAEADQHGKQFSELMIEWNPIMFSPQDLIAIAGQPTSQTASVLHYSFDNGLDGSYWQFEIMDDTIVGIKYTPGD